MTLYLENKVQPEKKATKNCFQQITILTVTIPIFKKSDNLLFTMK